MQFEYLVILHVPFVCSILVRLRMYVCMYVCMYASRFLLFRSTLPDPRGTGQVQTNPTIEVGKEVRRHSQYGLMLGFPSTYVQVKGRPVEYGPAT